MTEMAKSWISVMRTIRTFGGAYWRNAIERQNKIAKKYSPT